MLEHFSYRKSLLAGGGAEYNNYIAFSVSTFYDHRQTILGCGGVPCFGGEGLTVHEPIRIGNHNGTCADACLKDRRAQKGRE